MPRMIPKPLLSIWVPGTPKSQQAKRRRVYLERIRTATSGCISKPLKSYRIDIEIIFGAKNRNLRADVDNVAKFILDGLKGILYEDDRQVRSVRVVALPGDDAFNVTGSIPDLLRLLEGKEFLINVYEGLHII